MAVKRIITEKNLISKNLITEELKLIEGSDTDYITKSGKIYKEYKKDQFFQKKTYQNPANKYIYCGITFPDGQKSRRVHVLLAKAFIPNPLKLTVVGHLDNDKTNNELSNLYWTTVQENTQKAYNDGLARNAEGYEDSQSQPVYVFNLAKELLFDFGSVGQASRELGVTKGGILAQCKHKVVGKKPRSGYYFRFQEEFNNFGFVL